MKYYSEKLNKVFDSPEDCLKEEKEFKIKKEKEEAEEAIKVANISKQKKELSKAIEDASNKLTQANKLYDIAKDKAKEILEKSNKEINQILETAEKNIKDAQEERLKLILQFNKEFGTYNVSYTGEKALDEFDRTIGRLTSSFRNYFNKFLF